MKVLTVGGGGREHAAVEALYLAGFGAGAVLILGAAIVSELPEKRLGKGAKTNGKL